MGDKSPRRGAVGGPLAPRKTFLPSQSSGDAGRPRKGKSTGHDSNHEACRRDRAGAGPVLAYAWSNRFAQSGRSEVDLFKGLDIGTPIAKRDEPGVGPVTFLDVTDAALRKRIVERYSQARSTLGVDGFAIDLSNRT